MANDSLHIEPSALAVYEMDAPYDVDTDLRAKTTWKQHRCFPTAIDGGATTIVVERGEGVGRVQERALQIESAAVHNNHRPTRHLVRYLDK